MGVLLMKSVAGLHGHRSRLWGVVPRPSGERGELTAKCEKP